MLVSDSMEMLVVGFFLALVANRVVEALVAPVKKRWPELDLWWLIYVTWVFGGVLAWFADVNLFEPYIDDVLVGKILTAVVVGGGSNLLHDIFDGDSDS